MKILVACEESQTVTTAFRDAGHEAYSCDLLFCSGGWPEWHLQQDVVPLLNESWDMILAFPPCDHLCSSGARWFAEKRKDGRQKAGIDFFMLFTDIKNCKKVAIENPVGVMSTVYRKPDQIIQPWQYGHPYTKQTCLWLKGLPLLKPTRILEKPETGWLNQHFTNGKYSGYGSKWSIRKENGSLRSWGDPEVKKLKSKTFTGIAEAMARQWGGG